MSVFKWLTNYYYGESFAYSSDISFDHILENVDHIKTKIIHQKIELGDELLNHVAMLHIDYNAILNLCAFKSPIISAIIGGEGVRDKNKVLISLSGRIDSMVLITLFKYLGYNIVAMHINYNNRPETVAEQAFLEQWTAFNDIKLYVKAIDFTRSSVKKRTEYEMRTKKIRFDFYKEVMNKEDLDCVLLAHHKDDVIENIFANVCRGRNVLDLAVLREISILNGVTVMRPLLDFNKDSIREFAYKYQVPFFKDTTPSSSIRGKYRNQIAPRLEDAFGRSLKANLLEMSRQSDEWNVLIGRDILEPFLKTVVYSPDKERCVFNAEAYKLHPLCFWCAVFMRIFNKFGHVSPSRRAVQTFINAIQVKTVCYISIAHHCVCRNKNYEISLDVGKPRFPLRPHPPCF